MIARTMLAALLSFSSISAFAYTETGLLGLIQDVRNAYNWTCNGAACDAVWNEQVRSMNSLNSYVDAYLPDQAVISESVGRSAWSAADVICRSTARAGYQTLIWLVNAENRALSRLHTIQRKAGYRNPRWCQKTVN